MSYRIDAPGRRSVGDAGFTGSGGRGPGAARGRWPRGHAGFTLLELIVVIAIIAALASVVAPSVFQHVGDANVNAARSQIEIFGLALDSYRLHNGTYPTSEQGLDALRTMPTEPPVPRNWRGPYLRRPVPLDPWQRPYRYESPGRQNPDRYDLYTLGRDGEVGGEGEDADITSWGEAVQP